MCKKPEKPFGVSRAEGGKTFLTVRKVMLYRIGQKIFGTCSRKVIGIKTGEEEKLDVENYNQTKANVDEETRLQNKIRLNRKEVIQEGGRPTFKSL